MGRHANPDIRRAFAEFQDEETPSKCNKVRCLHCGYTRAKNTTRQIEHLQECQAYLASSDAQVHVSAPPSATPIDGSALQSQPSSQILSGQAPNPNLQVHRRGPNNKRPRDSLPLAPLPMRPPQSTPSLTAHLLSTCASNLSQATQQPFLSHAGCGSLAASPLSQWLVQDGHYARGYIRFIGQLLAKIRLPQTQNSQFHIMYRTMDLLISALNNMRREMQFFEITATKYGLALGPEGPTPITRALLDLFVSASSSSASLLEGMVVLWGTEHCYRSAWQYASSFNNSLTNPTADSHIVALHQVLIPNWTSPAFHKFVDATRALVDELANNSSRDGKEEMDRCSEIFKQICWLEQRFWPVVNGMGEEAESTQDHAPFDGPMNQNLNSSSSNFNNAGLNAQMNGAMAAPPMTNQPMGNQMVNRNGPMVNNGMNGRQMNSTPLSASNGNADEEDDASADGDNSGSFGLDAVGQMARMAQSS